MTESDLKEAGIESFGIRRKISMLMKDKEKCSNKEKPSIEPEEEDNEEQGLEPHHPADVNVAPQTSQKKSSLATYLRNNQKGRALAKYLDGGGKVSNPQRLLLVRLTVSYLTEKCRGLWPTTDEKKDLAKEIVRTWPALKDTARGLEGHEHYYSEGNGSSFIQSRLKNIRGSQGQRMRTTKKTLKTSLEEESDTDQQTLEKVEWMKHMPPKKNEAAIIEAFQYTHKYRQLLISQESLTITETIERFPRFKDMPELIAVEFQLLYDEEPDNFLKKWATFYRPRIISLAKRDFPSIQQLCTEYEECNGDMDMCGLAALLYMLHRPTARRKGNTEACSRMDAISYVIQNLPLGTDVQQAASEKDPKYRQPFLISLGEEKNPTQFFLIVDRIAIPAGTTMVRSFDNLFKSHFCFKVEYAPILRPIYQFISAFIYNILPPAQVPASIRSLAGTINALTEQDMK